MLVAATLASGWAWSSGAVLSGGGYNLLNLHVALGLALALGVLAHALLRARRPRRADVTDRRQFLTAAAVAGGSLLAWQLQRPVQRALGMAGRAAPLHRLLRRRRGGQRVPRDLLGRRPPARDRVRLPADRHGRRRPSRCG